MFGFQSLKSSRKSTLLLLELLLLGSLTWWGAAQYWPAASPAPETNPLQAAWELSQAVGSYNFSAKADQTLLPRPLPVMIGQTDRQVVMTIEGEVVSANETSFTFSVDGEGLDPTPISMVQQGTKSYLLRDGEQIPIENPAGALAPTGDTISYLAAAENIAPCPDTAPADAGTCYTFTVNGPKFAKHVQQQLQAQLEANPAALPPGAAIEVNVSPQISKMNGKGRVWLDEIGLPRQMKVNLAILENNEYFDSQVEMVVDYRFDKDSVAVAQQSLAKAGAWPLLTRWQEQLPGVLQKTGILLLSAGMFGLAVINRKRRWLYGVLVVLVSSSMVFTPLLQAAAYARFGNSRTNTVETLAGLITAGAEGQVAAETSDNVPAAPPAAPPVAPAAETYMPETYCGKGSSTQDIDGDKIPDAHENCIGTNPNEKDSDNDGLPDYIETQGFLYDGKTWVGDPLKPDSNGDGLSDWVEWKKTDDIGQASNWDLDGDKTPNVWDFDDDGDGVPDNRDLSPFSATGYNTDFDLKISGKFDGYVYIDVQVQPQNLDHLRYPGVTLDWNKTDTQGQIKDINNSEKDFRFIPMLEVYTNKTPEPSLVSKYGASIFVNDTKYSGQWTKMYLPLTVVGDGSRAEAFSGHLAYSANTVSDLGAAGIDWRDARIIWMMEFENDEQDSNGKVTGTKMTVQTYVESSVRVTGWQVTKSKDYRSAILGTPNQANNDRQLFQLLLGLSDTFLTHQKPDLDEVVTRFQGVNSPVEQKWGVDTPVAIDLPADPEPHADQNAVNLETRIRYFLNTHYNLDQVNALIIAGEEKSGSYNQDRKGVTQASNDIKVSLSDISLISQRTLSLQLRDGLTQLTGSDTTTAAEKRNEAAVNTALDDLKAEYPALTASELMALTLVMYNTWEIGRTRTQSVDNQVLLPEQGSDQDVYQQVYLTPQTRYSPSNIGALPGYLVEVGQFARKGAGLSFLKGMGQVWQYLQANQDETNLLGFTPASVVLFNRVEVDIAQYLRGAPRFRNVSADPGVQYITQPFNAWSESPCLYSLVVDLASKEHRNDVVAVGKIGAKANTIYSVLSAKKTVEVATKLSKFAKLKNFAVKNAGPIALVATIGLTWATFGLGGDYSGTAIASAIAATIFAVALFAISLNPVGAVLVAVFGIIDAILSLFPGAPSLSGYAIKYIAAVFYGEDRDTVTKIKDYRFEPGSSNLVNPGDGFAVGNRFLVKDKFVGSVTSREESRNTSDFAENINKSWVEGSYVPNKGNSEAPGASKNDPRQCSRNDILNNCTNQAGIEFSLNKPDYDLKLSYNSEVKAETRYVKCTRILFFVDCDMKNQKIEVPKDLDSKDKDQWKPIDIHLDVLPNNIDDLWNNSRNYIGQAPWVVNPDRDGDDLDDWAELRLGTKLDKWDSDDDGLSDSFEKNQNSNPNKSDSDGDGIDDLQELQRGTNPGKADSDGDGLNDGDEIFHKTSQGNWTGGWTMTLGGNTYRVFSDPLLKDFDRDKVSDLAEKNNALGSYAYNPAPQLSLQADPVTIDAAGRAAIYLKPGDDLQFTAQLSVFPPYTVSQAMSLELPTTLLENISAANITGDRTPSNTGKTGKPEWSFASPENTLQPWESVEVKVSARAKNLTSSAEGAARLTLPHTTGNNAQSMLVVIDADDPEFTITSPPTGKKIGDGASALVIGGFATDQTSWITQINLGLPGGSAIITETTKESGMWAYTWNLPPDGIHTLSGAATDYVGRTGAGNQVQVMVDNTPAEVTVNLQDNTVYGPPQNGDVISINLNGTASDAVSGLTAVQVSTDDGPWREVWTLEGATAGNTTFNNDNPNFPGRAIQATWSTVWELPYVDSVQGYHNLKVMAFDQLGNPPTVLERNIIVDVIPPSDELTNRTYLYNFPHVPAGSAHTFRGVANDVGHVPQPSRPADLSGSLDSITDATIQLGLSSIDDSAGGIFSTWIGDFNGDRRDDMLVGLPAAAEGRGRISIIYGRSGDWPAPNQQEMLADSPTSFVGEANTGLGQIAAPAGDVNGDGRADILIGDPANNRVYLVFGQSYNLGVDLPLNGETNVRWVILTPPAGQSIGQYLGAAGDVNGDGKDDILIGVTGGHAYLIPGRGSWWPLLPLNMGAAAVISGAGAATLAGLGDLNDDRYDEFAVGMGNTLYVFEGKQDYSPNVTTPIQLGIGDAVASFGSADSRPQVAALGNVNGDDFADFIYSNGGSQQVVFGNMDLSGWATHNFSYGSGFVAAPGDVNRDGLNDILIGGGGNAYLVLGNSGGLGGAAATINGVSGAGSAPSSQADLNSDGSSDLLLLPNTPAGQSIGAASTSALPELPPAWLPTRLKTAALPASSTNNFAAVSGADAYVNASNNCNGLTPCYRTIQEAVNVHSAGDLIIVQPGVYAAFTIDGKNNMVVRGMNADAVFVDGAGGGFAAKVANANGVRLERMTFQHAAAGVVLENAGGYAPPTDKVVLDTVLVRNVTANAVSMSRTSALTVTNSTLAAPDNHINVTGSFDPAFAPSWATLTNTPWALVDGGGLTKYQDKVMAWRGGNTSAFSLYTPSTNSWSDIADHFNNLKLGAGSVAAANVVNSNQLYAITPFYWQDLDNGDPVAQHITNLAYNPQNNHIFAAGPDDTFYEFDPVNGWAQRTGAVSPSPYQIQSMAVHPTTGQLYVGSNAMDSGVHRWTGAGWETVGATTLNNTLVNGLAFDGDGNLFAIDYSRHVSKYFDSSTPYWGIISTINAMPLALATHKPKNEPFDKYRIYVGGNFTQPHPYIYWTYDGTDSDRAMGDTINGPVYDIAIDETTDDVYVCGKFSGFDVARWDGSTWHTYPTFITKRDTGYCGDVEYIDGRLYALADYRSSWPSTNSAQLVRWNGLSWDVLADTNTTNIYAITEAKRNDPLLIDGPEKELVAGGWITQIGLPGQTPLSNSPVAQLSPFGALLIDGVWDTNRPTPPIPPAAGASYVGAANGDMLYIPGGGSELSYRYHVLTDTWTPAGVLSASITASAMTLGENGDVYAVVSGGGFYRNTGTAWVSAGEPVTTSLTTIAAGASLAYWPETNTYFLLPGGSGSVMLKNSGSGWEALPAELNTPAPINAGAGMAAITSGPNKGIYVASGNLPGGTSQAFWKFSYPPQPDKLSLDNVAFVSPSAGNWLSLPDPLPGDFGVSGLDTSQWFGGAGWMPTNGITLTETSADPFVDRNAGLYRMGQSGYNVGYHTYRDEVTVAADGSGDFTSIQAGLNSGSFRVKIEPGVYKEQIYLPSSVEVLGSNADWTVIRHPGGNTGPLVQASGIAQTTLALVTLDGASSSDGLRVSSGAKDVLFRRGVIFDSATAVAIDGSTTDLEIANTTLALNSNGVAAANCAPVDLRNTAIAYNSGVGLSYQNCAATKLHTYNLFWANNGGHFGADANAGAGELFIDPNFVDPTGGDYRTLNFSPVIDAGDPGDSAPPGEGNRIDIGYVEQGRAHFYVDATYCELCENDGLTWQVDAFATIQTALNAAANTVAKLQAAPEDVPQLLVSVAPGSYSEAVSVPSHVLLVGSGAENTTLDAGSMGSAVTFNGVTAAGVRDFTLTGAGSVGVTIKGAANDISVHHNIIRNMVAGLMASDRGTGRAEFNTIVNNTTGAVASGAGTWLEVDNNIFSGNGAGLSAAGSGQIFSRYNLLYNSNNYANVPQGQGDIVGQNPAFSAGGYRLTVGSPARDAASSVEVPAGGGARADMGYSELLAAPISLFLGKEDLSTAMGNSGVDRVEVALVPVADDSQPYTATTPSSWTPVNVDSPGSTVSYWNTNLTPPAEGMYRFYSRATDSVGNTETDETDWYAGSIVADNTPPAVTWLSPGSNPGVAPVELRAQVSDYVAGQFNIEEQDVYFVIDGQAYPATWAAEPWDEAGGQPRVFRAWVSLPSGSYSSVRAYAQDKADNNATASGPAFNITGIAPVDSIAPSVTVAQPTNGGYVTSTVTFKGATSDGGSGVAAVEISVDGGATWLPATVSGNNWEITWTGPEGLPFVSFPARARATDKAGNQRSTSFTFTIDEVAPSGLTPVTFSVPEGSHLDSVTSLGITWNQPSDGSGSVTTLVTADRISNTVPVEIVTGASTSRSLNASGDWYVHIAAQDAIGNKTVHHYGPWYVGLNEGVTFAAKQQSIVVDGYLDIDHGEWQPDEFLDNDERNIGVNVTYSPDGQQSFYTTWSGDQFYMAWQGGWWTLDGTLWVYLNTGGGGSSQLISPVTGAVLPFEANYAVEITSPDEGRLWRNSGGWQQAGEDWAFAQGDNGDTEIRLPLNGATSAETLAFAQGDDGNVWAIFPATNPLMPGAPEASALELPLFGTASELVQAHAQAATSWGSYSWPSLPAASEAPAASQPKAVNAEIRLDTLQSTEVAQGPGGTLQYVVQIINQEAYTLTNQPVAFLAFPGNSLIHDGIAGASCASTAPSWVCTVPSAPPGATAITLTTHLAADLSAIPEVTMVAVLQNGNIPPEKEIQGIITHRTDSTPPVVEVSNKPFVGLGSQTIQGTADDGEGIGVDYVEIQPEGGSWQRAQGTSFWSADLSVSPFARHGDNWRFYVRAVDLYGHTGEPVPYVFTVDLEGPDVSMDLPLTLAGAFNETLGQTNDSPYGSESVTVEARLDDDTWREAALFDPASDGAQPFLWTWNMPTEDGITHTVQLRAADIVGNIGAATAPYTVTVDNVPPVLSVTQLLTEVVVQDYRPTRLVKGPPVLTGTITDGGGVQSVAVRIELPDGGFYYNYAVVMTNTWELTPELTAVGTHTLLVEAFDWLSNTTRSEKYPLLVTAAPDTGNNPFLTFEDTPLTIEPLNDDLDLDGDLLYIEHIGQPLNGTATLSGALVLSGTQVLSGPTQLVYTPTLNFNGADAFTYTASDGVLTGTSTISITVLPINDAPVITPALLTTIPLTEDTRLELPLTVIDVDHDPITWTAPISPAHGLVALSALTSTTITVAYTPTAQYAGPDTFTLLVSDGRLTDTVTANLDIIAVDDPPLVADDALLVLRDGTDYTYVSLGNSGGLNVLNNDSDPEGLELTILSVSPPNHGGTNGIAANSKSVVYQPTAAFTGAETFTYTVTDGQLSSSATVSATVANGSSGGGSGDTFTTGSTGISNTIALTVEIPSTVITSGEQLALVYTMLTTPTHLPPGYKFAGVMFSLDAYLNGVKTTPYTFTTPVTVTISYSDTDVIDLMLGDEELGLWFWDGQLWQQNGITLVNLDTEQNQLVVAVTHIAEFALIGRNAWEYYLPMIFGRGGGGVTGLGGATTLYLPIISKGKE